MSPSQNPRRLRQRQHMPTTLPHNTPSIDLEEISSHWPPIADFSNETPAQRDERLAHEREAKRINDEIDAQIEIEKSERRRRRPDIRIILLGESLHTSSPTFFSFMNVLLLPPPIFSFFSGISYTGQAESGKSTILRNFQLKYAPTAFHAEAEAWRAVIDLNLVRSVTFLLNLLEESGPITTSTADVGSGSGIGGSSGTADSRPTSPSGTKIMPLRQLTDDLRRLRVSLSPLRNIEESLARFISPDHYPRRVGSQGGKTTTSSIASAALPTERAFEVSVRSGSRWKSLFKSGGGNGAMSKARSQEYEEVQNARRVIEACREDIVALWNHPAVRAGLADQSVSLEFQSGLCVASGLFFFPLRVRRPVVDRSSDFLSYVLSFLFLLLQIHVSWRFTFFIGQLPRCGGSDCGTRI
jgi:guanine nucleotide-binding protein alpha-1 subunit